MKSINKLCARAIDETNGKYVKLAIELYNNELLTDDFRENLYILVIIHHVIRRLSSMNVYFTWKPLNLKEDKFSQDYEKFSQRGESLNKLEVFELKEIKRSGKTYFEYNGSI